MLVGWKFYSKEKPIRVERIMQLGNLLGLLKCGDLSKKFVATECKGLITNDKNSRIGIIF